VSEYGLGTSPRWASDPTGRHRFRFWDGHAWTAHVYDGHDPPRRAPRDVGHAAGAASGDPTIEDAAPTQRRRTAASDGGAGGGGFDRKSFLNGAAGGAIVGVIAVLIFVVLGGNDDDKKTQISSKSKQTTTTTEASTTTTMLTTTTAAGRPPAQVRVAIHNGSGVGGAARKKSDALEALGYNVVYTGDAPQPQQGTIVECKPGFEADATPLATAVGESATVQPFPTPTPPGADQADCLVVLGTPTTTAT
jgi:gas vesicle protein